MKKAGKITLWVIGAVVALGVAAFLSADIIVSKLVQQKVRNAFEDMPEADAMVGGIYLNLISGTAIVKDITFCTNSLSIEDPETERRSPGIALHIPTLAVHNIRYADLLRQHDLKIRKIAIDNPQIVVYMDEKHPELLLPSLPEDKTLEKAEFRLGCLHVGRIKIKDLQARMHSTSSPMTMVVDSLSTEWRDIDYRFADSLFTFNDSVYEFSVSTFRSQLPDGVFAVEAHDVRTEDAGALETGYVRLRHSVSPKQLADMHREPVSWIDLELNSLATSPINPIRQVRAKDYTLEALETDVRRIHVHRDTRYAPKHPFGTPQHFLMSLPVRFAVRQVRAGVQKMDIEVSSTEANKGELHLRNMRAQMSNVTNRPGATWVSTGKAPVGQGHVDARYTMRMDKNASFEVNIKGSDLEIHDLNTFLRPLTGITCECHINSLDAQYSGDKDVAQGVFCMQYKGLNVQVHKEDNIPYAILAKNADLLSGAANTLIPKSNPTAVDIAPRAYNVSWKRDEWKPYPLYLFGPCIDGLKMTMLPGLYVHKQVRPQEKK